jgi:hypothetical protein
MPGLLLPAMVSGMSSVRSFAAADRQFLAYMKSCGFDYDPWQALFRRL